MEIIQNISSGLFLDPQKIIAQIDIAKGSIVADFGCASGYFSLPFAEAIGEDGKMYALDILPQVLETVESRARALGLSNVKTERVNLEKENGSGLERESLDLVIMKGVLFQNKEKIKIIKEAYRVLKPGGRALLVEWGDKNLSIGPHKNIRVLKEFLVGLVENEGFKIEKELEAGEFHYGLLAVK